MNLPLALKYRPSSFRDVIGQRHVTNSLMSALDAKQIHHAYLFSGPRGCGKTSSARILARSLNCENGPTSNPCEKCQSCQDLVANGQGSLDVIEMDAATHGLVDDARELRDKALFAPVQSRYKIYIIDEAHQLGPAAANALLKIVEEPPPYVIFIFATTEPEKVIPTIRSRTHHYQFRLVGPEVLMEHLQLVSKKEGVSLEEGAISLAVRSGNGSVRDSLSSLGQLLNGAIEGRVTYESALELLAQTSNETLNLVFDAVEKRDANQLFTVIESLVETGSDLRRFTLDLLDRIRDLMVMSATNAENQNLFRSYSREDLSHMQRFISKMPISTLITFSEIVAEHLLKLRVSVSPQITLETMMMRLLKAIETSHQNHERVRSPASSVQPIEQKIPKSSPKKSPITTSPLTTLTSTKRVLLSDLRILENNWPRVLEFLKHKRRLTWTLLSSQSHPTAFESGVVQISLPSSGALDSFERSNSGELLKQAMAEIFEGEFTIEMVIQGERANTPPRVSETDLIESKDQMSGEELLIKELGARVIERENQ